MIQTDSGRYAIRAMAHIAAREDPSQPISAAEIAEAENIPPYYLAKVLQDLARAGILASVRGRGGGFRITHSPDEIHVLEVLGAVENIKKLTENCVLGLDSCSELVPCPLHTTWKAFRDLMLSRLEVMTVSDLARELERKRSLLASSV